MVHVSTVQSRPIPPCFDDLVCPHTRPRVNGTARPRAAARVATRRVARDVSRTRARAHRTRARATLARDAHGGHRAPIERAATALDRDRADASRDDDDARRAERRRGRRAVRDRAIGGAERAIADGNEGDDERAEDEAEDERDERARRRERARERARVGVRSKRGRSRASERRGAR